MYKFIRIFIILLITSIFAISVLAVDKEEVKKEKLPNFTLKNLEGDNVEFNSLLGNGPIYIDFWATWCVPCKKEMIKLQEIYDKYKDRGFVMLSIANDPAKDESQVKKYIKKKKHTFLRTFHAVNSQNQHNGVYTQLVWRLQLRINGNYVNYARLELACYLG